MRGSDPRGAAARADEAGGAACEPASERGGPASRRPAGWAAAWAELLAAGEDPSALLWRPGDGPAGPVHLPLILWLLGALTPRRIVLLGSDDGAARPVLEAAAERMGVESLGSRRQRTRRRRPASGRSMGAPGPGAEAGRWTCSASCRRRTARSSIAGPRRWRRAGSSWPSPRASRGPAPCGPSWRRRTAPGAGIAGAPAAEPLERIAASPEARERAARLFARLEAGPPAPERGAVEEAWRVADEALEALREAGLDLGATRARLREAEAEGRLAAERRDALWEAMRREEARADEAAAPRRSRRARGAARGRGGQGRAGGGARGPRGRGCSVGGGARGPGRRRGRARGRARGPARRAAATRGRRGAAPGRGRRAARPLDRRPCRPALGRARRPALAAGATAGPTPRDAPAARPLAGLGHPRLRALRSRVVRRAPPRRRPARRPAPPARQGDGARRRAAARRPLPPPRRAPRGATPGPPSAPGSTTSSTPTSPPRAGTRWSTTSATGGRRGGGPRAPTASCATSRRRSR